GQEAGLPISVQELVGPPLGNEPDHVSGLGIEVLVQGPDGVDAPTATGPFSAGGDDVRGGPGHQRGDETDEGAQACDYESLEQADLAFHEGLPDAGCVSMSPSYHGGSRRETPGSALGDLDSDGLLENPFRLVVSGHGQLDLTGLALLPTAQPRHGLQRIGRIDPRPHVDHRPGYNFDLYGDDGVSVQTARGPV